MNFPSWKYRYFRLRLVDHVGYDDWNFGVTWAPEGDYAHGRREFEIWLGHRVYVFDCGMSRKARQTD
jgi:hypothetical protein